MSFEKYQGSCACKSVDIKLFSEPTKVAACHCSDCQKISGNLFQLSAIFDVTEWYISDPNSYVKQYVFAKEISGNNRLEKHVYFCRSCGTHLWNELKRYDSQTVAFPIGFISSVTGRPGIELFKPTAEIFTKNRAPFLSPFEGAQQFEYDISYD